MTDTPNDSWPTPEGETVILPDDGSTLVGGTPPPPPPGPPVPPPDGPPPDRRIGAGMLLALGAIVLVAAGIAVAWFLTHRSSHKQVTTVVVTTAPSTTAVTKVAVPRVVGLKEQDALVRLSSVGLRPKEVYKPTRQPKGVVVSQRPVEATEVKKGTQVTMVIDSGAPKVAVPDVGGQPVAQAQAALDKLGLDSTVTQVTSSKPAGTVVDQAPKPGSKLAKGSAVTLSVAKAPAQTTTAAATTTAAQQTTTAPPTTTAPASTPQTATVPNVTGQQESAAASALGAAGILPSLVFVPGTDPLGTVLEQAKPAGTKVPVHSHVQINVSSGPGNKPKVQVPNVVGQTLQQAVASMNGAHLRLIYLKYPVTSQAQAGKIVQQSPVGGNQAPQNAQILVFLGAFQR